jgi:hypothetical protein
MNKAFEDPLKIILKTGEKQIWRNICCSCQSSQKSFQ